MEPQSKRVRLIISSIIGAIIFIIFGLLPVITYTAPNKIDHHIVVLDEGWEITAHGKTETNQMLSAYTMEMCNKGETVIMRRTMPSKNEIKNAVLTLVSVHSTVEVYLDGKKIYGYGDLNFQKNKLVGYGKHFIDIPEDYAGKELVIELFVTEDHAFEGLQALELIDARTMIQYEIATARGSFVASIFLVVFGIICMFISLIMRPFAKEFQQSMCIALFSFLVGVWTMCNNNTMMFFMTNLVHKSYLEYLSLYSVPIPFIWYFRNRTSEKDFPKWAKIYFYFNMTYASVFFVVAVLLQCFNIVHYPVLLPFAHVSIGLTLILIMITIAVDHYNKRKRSRAFSFALAISFLVVLYEMVHFNLSKYFIGFFDNKYVSTVFIVGVLLVTALLMDFAERIREAMYLSTKQKLLENLAFRDELTGLSNRRKCDDLLLELTEKGQDYAVISLDLNLLKRMNDTLGHDKGDKALVDFSDALRDVFEEPYEIGRMGGDEFIVILPGVYEQQVVDKLLNELYDNLVHRNEEEEEEGIVLSAAWGYAFGHEVGKEEDAHAAYRKADERMYVRKRKMKMMRE